VVRSGYQDRRPTLGQDRQLADHLGMTAECPEPLSGVQVANLDLAVVAAVGQGG
jgi:hypothetical protein